MDDDVKSLNPKIDMTRRGFVAAALPAAGFALAAGPVSAEAIKTPADGLEAGAVMIPTAGGHPLPAYAAWPGGRGQLPVVLVVQEIFGVHEHIRDVCRRFAKAGYLAVAPELYFRQGDPSVLSDIPTILSTIVARVPDAQVMADLDAAAAWAAGRGGDPARLAVTGFCWGGRAVWLYAAHNPKVRAAAAWYGRLVGAPTPETPRQPLDLAADLRAPVLGLYGGADQGIPLDTIEKMKAAVKLAPVKVEFVVYPDAPHAFHADYRPSYRAEPAKDGWARTLAWFRQWGAA